MTDLRWVEDKSIVVASDSGAVGLWELDENETLVVSKACKYEHGDSATVGVLSSGILAAKVRDLGQQMELSSYQAPSRHVTCIAASLRGFCFFPAVRTRECYCVMPEPKPASLRGCSAPVAFSVAWLGILSRVRSSSLMMRAGLSLVDQGYGLDCCPPNAVSLSGLSLKTAPLLGPHSVLFPRWAETVQSSATWCPQSLCQPPAPAVPSSALAVRQKANRA